MKKMETGIEELEIIGKPTAKGLKLEDKSRKMRKTRNILKIVRTLLETRFEASVKKKAEKIRIDLDRIKSRRI